MSSHRAWSHALTNAKTSRARGSFYTSNGVIFKPHFRGVFKTRFKRDLNAGKPEADKIPPPAGWMEERKKEGTNRGSTDTHRHTTTHTRASEPRRHTTTHTDTHRHTNRTKGEQRKTRQEERTDPRGQAPTISHRSEKKKAPKVTHEAHPRGGKQAGTTPANNTAKIQKEI